MTDKYDGLSAAERKAVVNRILDIGLADARPVWRALPLSALFFGVEDCLFLSALLLAVGMIPAVAAAYQGLERVVPAALFLLSPALYAVPHLLTLWKDAVSGTLDWKRTCRVPLRTLLALRMLLLGGAAVAVSVPVCGVLWLYADRRFSLLWLLGLAFSSLFLCAALSLWCQRVRRGAVLVPSAAWILLGLTLLCGERSGALLLQVPAAVFFLLAGAGLALFLHTLHNMMIEPKGALLYAVR